MVSKKQDILDKLSQLEGRYQELERLLALPSMISDKSQYQQYAKELSSLSDSVRAYREFKRVSKEIEDLQKILNEKGEKEFLELVEKELSDLKAKRANIEVELERLLSSEDSEIDKDIIMEIRAGTGGSEASLFAFDLNRMYTKYATNKGWQVELLSSHPTELGGFKEIIFSVKGKGAYKRLGLESGVHRVQRVPTTESSGRIHTSTATVAVLVEPKDVELKLDPKDLKIDVFRSSGPGGQSVNTADSAVRITYLPTGMVVTCQDERSQLKNKQKALRVLRARLLDIKYREETARVSRLRKAQIGTAERSEKIRTYNFPDRRVTDHRIGKTIHRLDYILEGDMDELIDALISGLFKDESEDTTKRL